MLAFFLGFVFSAIGVGYFMYGRKQVRIATAIAGALLCVYPYFVGSVLWMCVIGCALLAVPFVTEF